MSQSVHRIFWSKPTRYTDYQTRWPWWSCIAPVRTKGKHMNKRHRRLICFVFCVNDSVSMFLKRKVFKKAFKNIMTSQPSLGEEDFQTKVTINEYGCHLCQQMENYLTSMCYPKSFAWYEKYLNRPRICLKKWLPWNRCSCWIRFLCLICYINLR